MKRLFFLLIVLSLFSLVLLSLGIEKTEVNRPPIDSEINKVPPPPSVLEERPPIEIDICRVPPPPSVNIERPPMDTKM